MFIFLGSRTEHFSGNHMKGEAISFNIVFVLCVPFFFLCLYSRAAMMEKRSDGICISGKPCGSRTTIKQKSEPISFHISWSARCVLCIFPPFSFTFFSSFYDGTRISGKRHVCELFITTLWPEQSGRHLRVWEMTSPWKWRKRQT